MYGEKSHFLVKVEQLKPIYTFQENDLKIAFKCIDIILPIYTF